MKKILRNIGATQSELAVACRVSPATISLAIKHDQWPKRDSDQLRAAMRDFFLARGVDEKLINQVIRIKKTGTEAATPAPAVLQYPTNPTDSNVMEDSMLLQNETLTPAARKHFGLTRNPFSDDITSLDDVYLSPDIRFCREA